MYIVTYYPDFLDLLAFKEPKIIELFTDLRAFILEIYPDSNELLYHTHALTAVFLYFRKTVRCILHAADIHKPRKFGFQQRNIAQ